MRASIAALAGLFLSATLLGCGGSATIPQPPSQATNSPPPGTPPEVVKSSKGAAGVMPPANPGKTKK